MVDNFLEIDHDMDREDTSGNSKTAPGDTSLETATHISAPEQGTTGKTSEDVKGGDSKTKFFAIRITGGQERVVANILHTKITTKKLKIHSILVLENFKGYIIVEAPDANVAYEALSGVRHIRGQIRGELPFKDIEGYLIKKPVVTDLNVDNLVEVVAGPFKSMKAKVTRVDYEKQEATVVLLDSPYQIPVTVDANYLRKIAQ